MAPSESIVAVLSPWPGTGGSTSVMKMYEWTNQQCRETQNYQGFNMKNKCVILHVCISAETGSMSQWREDDVQPSSCYQHLWQTFHLSFTSHCLKPSFLHTFSCESEVWNISVLRNVFNCSFHVRANETVCAPGKWWKEWLYKSQRKPSPSAPPQLPCTHLLNTAWN